MNRKIIQTVLAILVASLLLTAPRAQQTTAPAAVDRIALYQALLDLTNPWTVMCIAAHPDDEDGTSLIVMRRKYGAHTVSLFSTFGEGGQNAIGPELYEELGAIRARETKAAAEIQGSEPHFLGLKDFGFSKSADEAFRFWGHEEALRRMVLEIRKLRPDVIITNHSVTNNDHGHHQATARLELEAFDAAADPKRFPEQLKDGVTVWQVQRLFVRARGNQSQADNAAIVTVDPNERDPIRNATFAEEALSALQQHATQGPWPKTVSELAMRFRGSPDGKLPVTRYVLTREAKGAAALTKDSHNFLDGLKLPEKVASELELPAITDQALAQSGDNRSAILDKLIPAYSRGSYGITTDPEVGPRAWLMRERLEVAMATAAGVSMTVSPSSNVATLGSTVKLEIKISNTGDKMVRTTGCGSDIPSRRPPLDPAKMSQNGSYSIRFDNIAARTVLDRSTTVQVPDTTPINSPQARHLYEPTALGVELSTLCSIEVADGARFNLEQSTLVDVAPAVEIGVITPSPLVLTPAQAQTLQKFTIKLTNHLSTRADGTVVVTTMSGKSETPGAQMNFGGRFSLLGGKESEISVPIPKKELQTARVSSTRSEEGFTFLVGELNGKQTKHVIQASVPFAPVDARVAPNLRVGYVRGFDFSLPNALNALGVESKEVSVDEVKTADLQKYTSIIVDNRVYESTPGLTATNQKLLDYAKAGGTLIVFYHKSFEWNPDPRRNRPDQLAPYKLILGDERITDENAPITLLEPQHPLLNFPNKMGQEDFAGWMQERGLYYPKEWDPQFQALLQSNDPGETPLKGGLLVADYGRGKYIYTSMVWYRELRAGVPGAYRMLANMISYGRGK